MLQKQGCYRSRGKAAHPRQSSGEGKGGEADCFLAISLTLRSQSFSSSRLNSVCTIVYRTGELVSQNSSRLKLIYEFKSVGALHDQHDIYGKSQVSNRLLFQLYNCSTDFTIRPTTSSWEFTSVLTVRLGTDLNGGTMTHLCLNAKPRREPGRVHPLVVHIVHFLKVFRRNVCNVNRNGKEVLARNVCLFEDIIELGQSLGGLLRRRAWHLGEISAKALRPNYAVVLDPLAHPPGLVAGSAFGGFILVAVVALKALRQRYYHRSGEKADRQSGYVFAEDHLRILLNVS
jgi:hypothetical protein